MKIQFIIIGLFIVKIGYTQTDSIDYFGQTPPGEKAEIFAPGIISKTDRDEIGATFSINGKEFFYAVSDPIKKIYYTEYLNNNWTEHKEISDWRNYWLPTFSGNCNRVYFPVWDSAYTNSDIWMSERVSGIWSELQLLPSPINSDSPDNTYWETDNGNVYISSSRVGGLGHYDIWCIPSMAEEAENLGAKVNSSSWEGSPYIAQDESFLVFSSERPGGHGTRDIYICFHKENNTWTEPLNIEKCGAGINIPQHKQYFRSLSPDGKYMFFTRHNDSDPKWDIYWVSTSIIDDLKDEVLNVNNSDIERIKIYPNPTQNALKIEHPGLIPIEASYKIIDLSGKTIQQGKLTVNLIDISKLRKGIYQLSLNIENETISKKIIIK